ncbi:MAG: IS30 family transposase [Candidatus Moraniibacteriota bacterium]|nr:MAG: IS30 family transposase [Candidatus Moranbacteria bacterium]
MRKDERKIPTKKTGKMAKRETEKFVESELLKGHSPEQIAGRLKTSPPKNLSSCTDTSISYESIYDYIYRGEGRVGGWYKHLRRKQKRRRPKFSRKPRKETIPDRIPIHERPAVITKRTHFGDWETDSVIFSKQVSTLGTVRAKNEAMPIKESSKQNSGRKRTRRYRDISLGFRSN